MFDRYETLSTHFACSISAHAHPHIWITMRTEVVYAPDGRTTGLRHTWAFDDMFSTFATQGLENWKTSKFTARSWPRLQRAT